MTTYHRIDQLDTIVFGGVVTGGHHHTDPLSAELLGSQTSKQAHSKNNRVEKVTEVKCWSKCKQTRAIAGYVEAGQINPSGEVAVKGVGELTPSYGTVNREIG